MSMNRSTMHPAQPMAADRMSVESRPTGAVPSGPVGSGPVAVDGADRRALQRLVMRAASPRASRLVEQAGWLRAASGAYAGPGGEALAPASPALAAIVVVLFGGHLRHDPATPDWPARDRCLFAHGRAAGVQRALVELAGFRSAPPPARHRGRGAAGPHRGSVIGAAAPGALPRAIETALLARQAADHSGEASRALADCLTYLVADVASLDLQGSEAACARAARLGLSNLVVVVDESSLAHGAAQDRGEHRRTLDRLHDLGWRIRGPYEADDVVGLGQAVALARHERSGPTLIRAAASSDPAHPATPPGTVTVAGMPGHVRGLWDLAALGRRRVQRWRAGVEQLRARDPEAAASLLRRLSAIDGALREAPPQEPRAAGMRYYRLVDRVSAQPASLRV